MSNYEWFGEPHTLIVHKVTPPAGPLALPAAEGDGNGGD